MSGEPSPCCLLQACGCESLERELSWGCIGHPANETELAADVLPGCRVEGPSVTLLGGSGGLSRKVNILHIYIYIVTLLIPIINLRTKSP